MPNKIKVSSVHRIRDPNLNEQCGQSGCILPATHFIVTSRGKYGITRAFFCECCFERLTAKKLA